MKPRELKSKIKGVIAVQLFPFKENGNLDIQGLQENTEYLKDFANNGDKDFVILTNGSTSEFYAMSDKEQERAIESVVEASGDVPVLAGTGRAGTRETINISQKAQKLGVDGIMPVLPYYHQATREGMYQHYKSISDSVDVGIMLYNNPFASGSWVDADLLARISKLENIIAVKENTASGTQYQDITRKVDQEDITLICGLGGKMYPAAVPFGAKGFVSTPANFAPSLSYELYRAGLAKDVDRMQKAINKFKPYFDFMDKALAAREETSILPDTRRGNPVYQAMGKFSLDYVGLNGGKVRAPMVGLKGDEEDELKRALSEMGL